MDGSEFLGDLEGSQGSLLSCSPSATSLDIDGWFSYLAAQEGARPPQRPVLLQREDDPAEVLEVRTLAPAELGSQEAKHDVFTEDAFLMDHFEDWHAQDLEKILARGTTVQGELPVAVIDLHQEVEEPSEETKPNARTLEQAEAEAIREMMDEVRHKQEAAPRSDTHATAAGGSVVDDNNYDDVDMDFVKEEEDVSVDIDVDIDIEEDHSERADGSDGVDSADKASAATKDGRRQSLTGRRRWRRSLDGSSFSSPFSSPQPTSPTSSSTAGATTSTSTSSPLSPSASSPNRLVVKMRRVGQGLRVSGPAAADEPSAASLGPAAEKEPAASTTTTTPTSSSSTGGKKQPTSTSGGKGLVSPAKRKDGVLKKVQGYTLFCQEVRERIVSENEGLPFRELQKKYGEAWRALDKAEKDVYAAQADELNREAEAAAAAEEAALRAAAEEERRRRGLERKEQLVLEKRRQEEEQERKILEKTTGKMVIPRLYLGSKHVAANEAWMEQANCTHVLNVSVEVRNFFEKRGDVAYHRIRVSDDGTQKIDKFFEEGTDFIHRVIGSFVARKYVDKANLAAITPAAGVTALAPAYTSAAESAGAPEPMVVESTAETETATKTDISGPKSEETVSGSGEERTDAMKIENEKNENEESAEKAGEAKAQEAAVAKTEENGERGEAQEDDDEDGGGVNGPSVLVHCSEGRSRSPTLLIAYLMRYAKWSLKRAYEHLANLSSNLNINDGFKQQLMNYERTIHSLKTPSIDFFQRTLRTVRRAVSLGGKSGPALSALNPPSTTSLAFTSPMVSRKRPPSRSAAAGAAATAAPTTLDDVPSFIATSPSSSTTKMRRQSTGSSHHTPAARSSPSASARLPSFTPPIPVKRKRIINRKICDEELTVQKKIDSYFASPAPSTPLFAPPTHPSSKRKASAAAQAAAKRRREQLGGSTSDETDVDHSGSGGGKAADARDHDDDDEDEEKENRKVTNNKRGRSASLEGTKAAGGKRPKRRRDEDEDDDDDDESESESESDDESEEEESEDDDGDDDDELEYGKKKKKQSKPKKKPAGKKVRGKKGATTPKKAKKAKAASTPKTKTATGTKDADRVQEVVSPDLGSITILYPFDEETVKSWSSARLSAWKLRHENANAYYYRFEDPVVKQSHRASTTEQKQENHEAFMARYDEFVREGWIIGTAWGLFSKAVPGFVGYQCANYYRKLVKDGNLEDRSYTTDEKGDLKKVQRASSKGENETLNNQLNDVWRTPEVKWIESCVSKWVTKYHAKGAEKSKGTPRKMKKGGKNDD